MWLDRLGHAGPNSAQGNGSRSASPFPQRIPGGGGGGSSGPAARGPYMTSQRPPRSSSLTLALNDSSTSLLPSRRSSPQPPQQQQQQQQQQSGRPLLSRLPSENSKSKDAAALALLGRLLGEDDGEQERERTREHYEITDADLEADFDFGDFSLRELVHSAGIQPLRIDQCRYTPRKKKKKKEKKKHRTTAYQLQG